MNIIQTLWYRGFKDYLSETCGWISPEYNLMSWALSCLQLNCFYKDVTLYADSTSAKILVDILQLPYVEVICNLDHLNNYHHDLFALPKIHSYSIQEKPFLHVDGDVFIWKPFNEELLKSPLIAQNKEIGTDFYKKIFNNLEAELKYLPDEIKQERERKESIYAYNAGIMGGSDLDFFKIYTEKAFEFVNSNTQAFNKINVFSFNISYEQHLFYCIAKRKEMYVNVLFPDLIKDNRYTSFGSFSEVPYKSQYIHMIGKYKSLEVICNQMAYRLRQDYPEYYYRIIELYAKKRLPLFKNYYYFLERFTGTELVNRSQYLNTAYNQNALSKVSSNIERQKISIKPFEIKIGSDDYIAMEEINEINCKLSDIISSKFSWISRDYLYARDLACTMYFEYIFGAKDNAHNRVIVRDENVEIIESSYDFVKREEYLPEENAKQQPGKFYTAVIPECHKLGFSLVKMDELDVLIIELLYTPIAIALLLIELKSHFHADDLAESFIEFEKLIMGRIENGIIYKTIKCIIE